MNHTPLLAILVLGPFTITTLAQAETVGYFSGWADGGSPSSEIHGTTNPVAGGDGGHIDIQFGRSDVILGDGSGGIIRPATASFGDWLEMPLGPGEYFFKEVGGTTLANIPAVTFIVHGRVIIHCQYTFQANIRLAENVSAETSVTIFAGTPQPTLLRYVDVLGNASLVPQLAAHIVSFNLEPPDGISAPGGSLTFHSVARGEVLTQVLSACGGNGLNGGDGGQGGSIGLQSTDGSVLPTIAFEVRGGDGTSPTTAYQKGGRGGDGGTVMVAAGSSLETRSPVEWKGHIYANGGKGGDGAFGYRKPPPYSEHLPDGMDGGDGGAGGGIKISRADFFVGSPNSISMLNAAGGAGGIGAGGYSASYFPYVDTLGLRGGNGGRGGHGGPGGTIEANYRYFPSDPFYAHLQPNVTGGKGGAGSSGDNGCDGRNGRSEAGAIDGGDGGDGGNGGNGGWGGAAGTLIGMESFGFEAADGTPGAGGRGGNGGKGGYGTTLNGSVGKGGQGGNGGIGGSGSPGNSGGNAGAGGNSGYQASTYAARGGDAGQAGQGGIGDSTATGGQSVEGAPGGAGASGGAGTPAGASSTQGERGGFTEFPVNEGPDPAFKPQSPGERNRWNVMYYATTERMGETLPEMKENNHAEDVDRKTQLGFFEDAKLDGKRVSILCQLDRSPLDKKVPIPDPDAIHAEMFWTDARRSIITHDGDPKKLSSLFSKIGSGTETDTGEPEPLAEFLAFCAKQRTSEHNLLILDGHGNARAAMGDGGTQLRPSELGAALQLAPTHIGILYDACCQNASCEFMYSIRQSGKVDYFVGWETKRPVVSKEPLLAQVPTGFVESLVSSDCRSLAINLAQQLSQSIAGYRLGRRQVTAVDVRQFNPVVTSLRTFADRVANLDTGARKVVLDRIAQHAKDAMITEMATDLGHMMALIVKDNDLASLHADAQSVQGALSCVLRTFPGMSERSPRYGLSVCYWPVTAFDLPWSLFVDRTNWIRTKEYVHAAAREHPFAVASGWAQLLNMIAEYKALDWVPPPVIKPVEGQQAVVMGAADSRSETQVDAQAGETLQLRADFVADRETNPRIAFTLMSSDRSQTLAQGLLGEGEVASYSFAASGRFHLILENPVPVEGSTDAAFLLDAILATPERIRPVLAATASIDFAAKQVNEVAVPKTLEITNAGLETLAISSIEYDLDSAFRVADTDIYPLQVGPGETIAIALEFLPETVGEFTSTLTIHSNDPTSPTMTVALTGQGAELADTDVPASEVSMFELTATGTTQDWMISWSGFDGVNGKGVRDFDILVSTDGGAYTLWLDDTQEEHAVFTGTVGHTYRFISLATDRAGNSETLEQNTSSGFSAWSHQFWAGIADPAIIGPSADPDGDGIANLMEYALGEDPTAPDVASLPWLTTETLAGERHLAFNFWRPTTTTDIDYRVLASDTLDTPITAWQEQTQLEIINDLSVPSGYEWVRVIDTATVAASQKSRYLRLAVELKEAAPTP